MELRYHKSNDNADYLIPENLTERFLFVKSKTSKERKIDFPESYAGYLIVLESEFNMYKVIIKKGNIWYKKTEQWQNNSPKGTPVKVIGVCDDFVEYKEKGNVYILNKWSFLRIFEREV